jgi:hypothetical protein
MDFLATFTHHASRVEMWIRYVKEKFLNTAPVKCVGVGCKFSDAPRNVRQKKLPYE